MQIEKSYLLPYPCDAVYAAWISSETVIAPAARMEIEPRVGGLYQLVMPDGMRARGRFERIEPGRRLVYGWQWDGADETTRIDVRFASEGTGTRITLVHGGFDHEESRANHDAGWDSYIDGFIARLGERHVL